MPRRFHSYGPVDPDIHYCVPRTELVESCVQQLVGDFPTGQDQAGEAPAKGGHYFTIWAPRQTGKTWLMRRAIQQVRAHHGDRFSMVTLTLQRLMKDNDPDEVFLRNIPRRLKEALGKTIPALASFEDWLDLFSKSGGIFDRPTILLIDEFDSLTPSVIDTLVALFRQIYLTREAYHLHGLALIGVRALLGGDSASGSPFNVQRSLHVPNLSRDEAGQMFQEYQGETGQHVDTEVVDTVHWITRGQPGLLGWFAELLTEKYNPRPQPITMQTWTRVYAAACQVEPNNTMLNLLKKAKGPYLPQVLEMFGKTDVPFSFGQEWCNYLYLNGILDHQETLGQDGQPVNVCRFSSPFVQQRLFNDLSTEIIERLWDLPLDPLDTLSDVFTPAGIDVPALLGRYVAFLGRLRKQGEDPWKHQPRRADLPHTEAVAHFHLYTWLTTAVGKRCIVSPEFPTGNGTVDLVLRWSGHLGIIEVKSFVDQYQLKLGREQAAGYAQKLGFGSATVAVFVPVTDEEVLSKLSGQEVIGGVTVTTVAISWGR